MITPDDGEVARPFGRCTSPLSDESAQDEVTTSTTAGEMSLAINRPKISPATGSCRPQQVHRPRTGGTERRPHAGWEQDDFAVYVWRSIRRKGDTKTVKPHRSLTFPRRCVDAPRLPLPQNQISDAARRSAAATRSSAELGTCSRLRGKYFAQHDSAPTGQATCQTSDTGESGGGAHQRGDGGHRVTGLGRTAGCRRILDPAGRTAIHTMRPFSGGGVLPG